MALPAGSSVDTTPDKGSTDAAVYGWDYSATTHDAAGSGSTVAEVVQDLTEALGGDTVVPDGKGFQGWVTSLDVFDGEGFRLGRVFYGGDRTDVHVLSTSAPADVVRETLSWMHHPKTARVDTRVDSRVGFDDLAAILEEAGEMYGSEVVEISGRKGHRGDRHDSGRTVMLGAPSSAIRVRLYEKWLESPGEYEEGTNRVEVQLRPPSKVKTKVSSWSRPETFCASKVTRTLAERLGADLAPAASLHVARGTPDLEASLAAMRDQYGNAAKRWLEVSKGDVGTLVDYLTHKALLTVS